MITIRHIAALSFVLFGIASQSLAANVSWTNWSSNTAGIIATPNGNITVTYSGELSGLTTNYPSWAPSSTFADGSLVANVPSSSFGMIKLIGGNGVNAIVDTIIFSTPVVDPVLLIWSLGDLSTPATFVFDALPTLVSGGPSAEYGGSVISVSGHTVTGAESNGAVQFLGTYSSISWTNPIAEGYYGFTTGVINTAVPEIDPAGMGSVLALVTGALGLLERRRMKAA